jgi:hypothetical protein
MEAKIFPTGLCSVYIVLLFDKSLERSPFSKIVDTLRTSVGEGGGGVKGQYVSLTAGGGGGGEGQK